MKVAKATPDVIGEGTQAVPSVACARDLRRAGGPVGVVRKVMARARRRRAV